MYFKNKVIWITGASSGIGEALSVLLDKEGAELIISGSNKEKLEKVFNKISTKNKHHMVVAFDLSNPEEIKKAAGYVLKNKEHIDILINNGGISQRSYAADTPIEVDRKIMEINFFGNIYLTKLVIPRMIDYGNGHIVAISSITGKFGFPLRSAYSASKHALHGFYDSLRAEIKKNNLKVTVICPGRIKTNISLNAITRDGSKYGIMDSGQEKGMTAEKLAEKVLHAIRKYKKEPVIGGPEILMVYIKRFLPALYFKIASKLKPT